MGSQRHPPRGTQRSRGPHASTQRKDSHTSTRHKLFGTGRRAATTLGTVFTTAVISWAVAFYAPGVASHKTENAVVTDVQDDPFGISTFNNLSVEMFVPASAVSPRPRNPPIDYCNGFHDWGRSLGGADVNTTHLRLIVQGTTDSAVIITGLSARVLDRKAVNGLYVECTSEGEAQIRVLTVNLDSPNPSASYHVEGRLSPFGFTLKKGETEVFDVAASTSSSMMTDWDLILHLTVDGKEQSIEVQDRGKPFRTVAEHTAKWYVWNGSWSGNQSPFDKSP